MRSSRSDLAAADSGVAGFRDNASHLRAELDWVRRLVGGEILADDDDHGVDEFSGLCISREQVDRYLRREDHDEDGARPDRPHDDAVHRARADLDERIDASLASGVDLRLARLVRAFDLEDEARVALLCTAAAEIDPQIARLCAYLQNDATKKRPPFGLLVRLASRRLLDPVALWQLFGPSSRLIACRLLDPGGESADVPLALRESRLAAGVIEFLLGFDALPSALAYAAHVAQANEDLEDIAYHRHHRAVADELLRCRHATGRLPLSYIAGPNGAGHRQIASAVARSVRHDLLIVRWAGLRSCAGGLEEAGRVLNREARLRRCVVLLEDADEGAGDREAESPAAHPFETLARHLSDVDVIATGRSSPDEFRHRAGVRALGFELPYPTATERFEIWQRVLPATADAGVVAEVPLLAQKFKFTPGQIERAMRAAEMAAPSHADAPPHLTGRDLYARCRDEAHRSLHRFCERIVPRFDWDDIVLPADTHAQLQEICQWVKHRARVYDAWGFGGKLAVGRGVAVLFSGASGTGKTMSAEVIAADLQLDLFRVDLSRIVSKYIGETEKNLSRVFDESAVSNCVLFFDEADALFGKRTEVKDAHDRYANIEVNYLLSEMDRCEGVVIVSTNIKGNLDPAFIRRFSHVVEYPVPNERLRQAIWTKAFPAHTPRGADVDFAFLAQRFNLAGGHIKNIALTSAFLAAAESSDISMEHVIRATKREYQKIGRICSKSDFGPYYGLVREAEGS